MLGSLAAKILAGALAVAVVISLGLGWQLKRSWQAEAVTRLALNDALSANASLIDDRKRALAEAERNRQISATAMRESRALDEKIGRLKEKVLRGDACLIDPADAAAMDSLFQ